MTAAARPTKPHVRRGTPRWGALLAAIMAVAVIGTSSAPHAATTQRVVVDRHTGLALYGIDPVGYFTNGKPTTGSGDLEYRYAGAIWRFENEGNRAAFIKDPATYMPRFGGYDPLGVARGVAIPGYPALWSLVEDRLYLFYSPDARQAFLADPQAAIEAADARWAQVMKDLPE